MSENAIVRVFCKGIQPKLCHQKVVTCQSMFEYVHYLQQLCLQSDVHCVTILPVGMLMFLFFSTVRFATPTHRAHGFSHGLSPFSQYPHRPVYPQYYSSPHIHRATSTIFTPGGSFGRNLASCSGPSAVTQDDTKLERFSVDEVIRGIQKAVYVVS